MICPPVIVMDPELSKDPSGEVQTPCCCPEPLKVLPDWFIVTVPVELQLMECCVSDMEPLKVHVPPKFTESGPVESPQAATSVRVSTVSKRRILGLSKKVAPKERGRGECVPNPYIRP